MEEWQLEFEWVRLKNELQGVMGLDKQPDLNAVLLFVGVQELGFAPRPMTKEVKQDLMHIAVCALLSEEGYYQADGVDEEGWPHYRLVRPIGIKGEKEQEQWLKGHVVRYFKKIDII